MIRRPPRSTQGVSSAASDVYKRQEQYNGFVYDLNVENARNYIANNIVVHNCIYQWRGADIENILSFEKDYPNAKVIKLEQNYRSKGNILDAANTVIVNNSHRKSKVLRTEQEGGSKINIYRAYSDSDEGDFVGSQISKIKNCLLYTSPSPRDLSTSRMPSSA
eukprot:TRINITY_DN14333_c0_g1_i2.p1 TRINITY_DN14333_c0_g1~~TRINITY_DN14333_c0_g1_i2.p1  ORF type:complete len:163 (-),score=31.70 TRINITY_DN14333_c0_g1_i2:145-633(-)